MPWSRTEIRAFSAVASSRTSIGRRAPNFTALERRFVNTCSMRMRSQVPFTFPDTATSRAHPARSQLGAMLVVVSSTHLRDVHLLGGHRHPPPAHVRDVEEAIDELESRRPWSSAVLIARSPASASGRSRFERVPEVAPAGGAKRSAASAARARRRRGSVPRLDGLERLGQQGAVLQADRGTAGRDPGQHHVIADVAMGIGRGHQSSSRHRRRPVRGSERTARTSSPARACVRDAPDRACRRPASPLSSARAARSRSPRTAPARRFGRRAERRPAPSRSGLNARSRRMSACLFGSPCAEVTSHGPPFQPRWTT